MKVSDGKVAGVIQKIITYSCRVCGSTHIIKNGTNRLEQQQYYCKDCGARRVLELKRREKTQRPFILKAYQERMSLPGLSQVYGIQRQSISRWIVDHVKSCHNARTPTARRSR